MKYTVIVNVNLEYEFDTKNAQQAYVKSQNVELPPNYVEWSRDTVKIISEDWEEHEYNPEDNEEETERICDECWKYMKEWYCISWGEEYYCNDECLHKHITEAERKELYDDWNWDSYWTEREE